MQRGNKRRVPATRGRGPLTISQAINSCTIGAVDIIDSFMISRRVSVAEMLHTPRKNHEWSRSCGTPVREARFSNRVSWRAEHRIVLSALGGVQVAVVTGRGCGHAWGCIVELPSRNQPRVADRHRDGDGPVRVDESSVKKRAEQGRFSGGCAQ